MVPDLFASGALTGERLAEWVADGVCRCPDECLVGPREWCEHGLASWWLILRALEQG